MTHPRAPTVVLPALATLLACDAACIGEALRTLQDVYFPPLALQTSLSHAVWAVRPVRKACLVHHDGVPDSGYASAEEDGEDDDGYKGNDRDEKTTAEREIGDGDEALDVLRSDALERGYAIRWLTGLVKRGDTWVCVDEACDAPSCEELAARTARLEWASRLLARFAGNDAPEEALTRTFVFPLRMPSCDGCHASPLPPITVELNDAPVDGSDYTTVGLQSWGSAIVFARRMCLDPERYLGSMDCCASAAGTGTITLGDGTSRTMAPRRRRRVLELGAGTGLLSIAAAQILARTSIRGEIEATDYHPSVLDNLARNVAHNVGAAACVRVERLDWCEVARCVGGMGTYDVVLAADVVYHPEHARWIRGCVERTLEKGGVFWLIIPVRTVGRHAGLEKTVGEAIPVVGGAGGVEDRLSIVRREQLERVDGVGRADEGGYTLFEIRWVS